MYPYNFFYSDVDSSNSKLRVFSDTTGSNPVPMFSFCKIGQDAEPHAVPRSQARASRRAYGLKPVPNHCADHELHERNALNNKHII